MADCYARSISLVKAILLKTHHCPVSNVVEVVGVMTARQSNVMWEQYSSYDMLISMDGICCKNELDFVSLSVSSLDLDTTRTEFSS